MLSPIFSIIMPTYNRAILLKRAIKSVINQTIPDFELIIIDDGSTDDTEKIVNLFSDQRVVYNKFAQNRGVNSARNKGLYLARGKFITFLDSDDELLPNALEIYLTLWQQTNNERIGNIVTRTIDSETGGKIGYLEKDNMVLGYIDIVCRQKVQGEFRSCWKKDAIGDMRFEESLFYQESVLWWRLAKKWDFLYTDIPTVIYYKNSDLSLCAVEPQIKNASKMVKATEILINEHSEVWKKHCQRQYIHYLNAAAIHNLMAGNKQRAWHWLRLSLGTSPFFLKTWVLFFLSFMPVSQFHNILRLKSKIKRYIEGINSSKLRPMRFRSFLYIPKLCLAGMLYYTGISKVVLKILLKIKPTNFIFMYHRINNDNNGLFLGVKSTVFKEQIKLLNRYFEITTLSEFINLNNDAKKSYAVITFDDGYKGVYSRAWPILKENNISATVFLATGVIDNNDIIWTDKVNLIKDIDEPTRIEIKNRLKSLTNTAKDKELGGLLLKYKVNTSSLPDSEKMLSWEEVGYMAKEGIEFGAHTVNHPILSKVNEEETKKEISDSKHRIEHIIGKPVTTFCYPNGQPGDFDESTKQVLKENGFKCAVTTIEGNIQEREDYFSLRRISLANRPPSLAILMLIKAILKNV